MAFMNSDGSALVGALNPSNQGQALQLDASGNLKVTGGGGGGGGGTVNLADPNTPANKAAVDALGNQLVKLAAGSALAGGVNIVDGAGTNKLAVDSSGRLTLVPNQGVNIVDSTGVNKLAVDSSGRLTLVPNQGVNIVDGAGTNKLAVDGSGRLTLVPNQSVNIVDGAGTNKLAVDSSGRLTLVPNQSVNLAQWNAATPGVSNPVITQDQIRAWLLNAQGFSATTGKQTAAGAITGGLSVFNPAASGKTLLLYSLTFLIGNNSFNQVNFTSSDPALGTSATVSNNKNGGSASVASCSFANTNLTVAGSNKDFVGGATNTFVQLFSNGNAYVLPAGSGVVFYSNLSGANSWLCSMAWIEM